MISWPNLKLCGVDVYFADLGKGQISFLVGLMPLISKLARFLKPLSIVGGRREEGDHGSLGQLGVEGSQLGELGLRLGAVEVNA